VKKREEEIVRAIYHKDAANFFESIGYSEKLAQGEIRCFICEEIITLDNFRAVARKSDKA
jgi:predicted adenine nucleotide alpha hydrolase (AANH) superfamily ATPase